MLVNEVGYLAQWDKLIDEILRLNKNLRFDDLRKALVRMGYKQGQPRGGSSHYTFRKQGCAPITLPKSSMHVDIVYIRFVKDAVINFMDIGGEIE